MMPKFTSVLLTALLLAVGTGAQAEQQSLTPIPNTPMAPDFTLDDLNGDAHSLSDYRGRVVILNFWATWCPPCRREMPSMERAWQQLKKHDVVMLAVDVGEDLDTVYTFLADYPVSFPLLLDEDAQVVGKFPVRGLPTSYVIDPEGRLVYQAIGGREWDEPEILEKVRALRESAQVVDAVPARESHRPGSTF